MARIPELTREQLAPEHRPVYDELAASRGGVVGGPSPVLLNSPQVALRTALLGNYFLRETTLSPHDRELVVLAVSREWDCQFVWTSHRPRASQPVREEAISAIQDRRAPDGLTEEEAVVVRYVRELLRSRRVSETTFQAALERFGRQGVTDLTAQIGYYSMTACVFNAFEVQPPPGVTPLLPV